MKTVGIDKDISIVDKLRFILETKDTNDCLITPYKINSVVIYFVSREFTDPTASSYEKQIYQNNLVLEYEKVKKELCLKAKDSVLAATTENIILFGLQAIDGIILKEGNRVLVKNQANPSENGIYVVSSESWDRADDANENGKILNGMYVFVDEGIENISTGWVVESQDPIKIGVSSISFLNFSANGKPPSPDSNSLSRLLDLKKQIEDSKKVSSFFYKDAQPVKVFGGEINKKTGELFPAWLNPNMVPAELKEKTMLDNLLYEYEEEGKIIQGKYVLEWQPLDMREGDYFICWNWTPKLAGESLAAHDYFSLDANSALTVSIPTHLTDPRKYEMLLERYTPEMFKSIISENDQTPWVMKGLNSSAGAGFTVLENLANQIIDLLDANATHEQLLPLLSNLFGLRLKSSDPTLWRRQIKKAIPNFKRKGTIAGLKSALGDIGMKFKKLTRLWQVISKYTHQEHFVYKGEFAFALSKKMMLPIDQNFGLWVRRKNQDWLNISDDFASHIETYENSIVWIGPDLSEGDSIRILYRTKNVPVSDQSKENYIRSLPLLDERDERNQEYPPKNWNVRALEEDDPMFDLLIPTRHPLADPVIWGRIRTEFPYSENAYNMDEYNGSKRDSINPCDIDKKFVDPCGSCQSSSFILDLEVEKLSDDSFNEVRQIVDEYLPFHSRIHNFNLEGSVNEFIRPAFERIDFLISISKEDTVIAGEGQRVFNRDTYSSEISKVKRDLLASYSPVSNGSSSTWSGSIKNQRIILLPSTTSDESDLVNFKNKTQGFESININTGFPDLDPFASGNLLEILGSNIKNYTISNMTINSAEIFNALEVEESLIGPLFEYRLSNKVGDFNINIEQSNQTIFSDENADFYMMNIVTQYDVDFNLANGSVWKIRNSNKEYSIQNILPDGSLLLKQESTIDPVVGWELVCNGIVQKYSDSVGSLDIYKYGLVSINSPVQNEIKLGDYVYFDSSAARSYKIKSLKSDSNQFYIENYDEGSMAGEDVKIYRRILENKVGQLGYDGIELSAETDLETSLSISNGKKQNPSDLNSENIKENYLLFISGKYYIISDIDGSKVVLGGPLDSFTIEGQEVDFMVYKFNKENLELSDRVVPPYTDVPPKYEFNTMDRAGRSVLTNNEGNNRVVLASSVLNSINSNQPIDIIGQDESIEFNIEYKEENE